MKWLLAVSQGLAGRFSPGNGSHYQAHSPQGARFRPGPGPVAPQPRRGARSGPAPKGKPGDGTPTPPGNICFARTFYLKNVLEFERGKAVGNRQAAIGMISKCRSSYNLSRLLRLLILAIMGSHRKGLAHTSAPRHYHHGLKSALPDKQLSLLREYRQHFLAGGREIDPESGAFS